MKLLSLLSLVSLLCGCTTVDRPYVEETITSKDGTVRTIKTSADKVSGPGLDGFRKLAPTR